MTHKTIKAGVLTFGKSGSAFHTPFLNAHQGFELKAIVERNHKKAQTIYPDIISYDSVEQILNDRSIDLIVVNSPDHLHFEHAKAALLAGKHVLLEKPATIISSEIRELFNLAEAEQRHLLLYQNRRYDTDFLTVKRVIESGRLGKLKEVHFRYDFNLHKDQIAHMPKSEHRGGDIVYGLGPHILDQIISLFGMPLSVVKTTSKTVNPHIIDFFSYVFKFPEDLTVFASSNLSTADMEPAFKLRGTKGSFIKNRSDIQEDQLLKGTSPKDEFYALENQNNGLLTTLDTEGNKIEEFIKTSKSTYMKLFDDVYDQIVYSKDYPVKKEEVIFQIELLEREDDF